MAAAPVARTSGAGASAPGTPSCPWIDTQGDAAPVAARRSRQISTARRLATASLLVVSAGAWLAPAALASPGDAPTAACEDGIDLSVRVAPPSTVVAGGTQTFDYTVCDHVASPSKSVTQQVFRLNDPRRSVNYPGNAVAMTPASVAAYPNEADGTWQVPANAASGTYAVVVRFYSSPDVINAEAAAAFQVSQPAITPPSTPASPVPDPLRRRPRLLRRRRPRPRPSPRARPRLSEPTSPSPSVPTSASCVRTAPCATR